MENSRGLGWWSSESEVTVYSLSGGRNRRDGRFYFSGEDKGSVLIHSSMYCLQDTDTLALTPLFRRWSLLNK